jgi:hypothetical protein
MATDAKRLSDPKFWLNQAKEARAQAERMRDPEVRRQMLEIAASYERLAGLVAKRRGRTLH